MWSRKTGWGRKILSSVRNLPKFEKCISSICHLCFTLRPIFLNFLFHPSQADINSRCKKYKFLEVLLSKTYEGAGLHYAYLLDKVVSLLKGLPLGFLPFVSSFLCKAIVVSKHLHDWQQFNRGSFHQQEHGIMGKCV